MRSARAGIKSMLTIREAGHGCRRSSAILARSCRYRPNRAATRLSRRCAGRFRPLPFMQECREKFGDSFSVRFLGFERPMVLISDPAAIKALYMERSHGLPPGRDIILKPILGAAVAAAAGRRRTPHPPQADAAALPRRADALLRVDRRRDRRRRDRFLAARPRVPDPLADAGGDPGGDPAGRLRRLRAARGWSACAGCSPTVLQETASPRSAADRPRHAALRRPRSVGQIRRPAEGGRRAALRRDRRAPRPRRASRSATTSSRC